MLKNVLIVVDDIEKSIGFYKDLFGLQVILKNEGNVMKQFYYFYHQNNMEYYIYQLRS